MSDQVALTDRELSELVDEGGKLHDQIEPLEKKQQRLQEIKAILRASARGRDLSFLGDRYSASVEQKPDTICRVVPDKDLPFALKLALDHPDLFTMHPSKGKEKSFELNALKLLAKRIAQAAIKRFAVKATAWVRFSLRAAEPAVRLTSVA